MWPGEGPAPAAIPMGPADQQRIPRDIFPLPSVQFSGRPDVRLSRGCQQRLGRRRHFEEEVQHTLDALNRTFEGTLKTSFGATSKAGGILSAGQRQVFEFIEHAISGVGSPVDITGPEALEALRVSEGYEGLPTSSPLGSYNPDLVSLPSGEMNPVSLESLWGPGGREAVQEFVSARVLGPSEAQAKLIESGVRRVYQDPQFNSSKTFAGFVMRLHGLGLVEFSAEPAVEEVGLFFVKKKQNRLRMIMDCRRSNSWFTEPKKVHLASGEALGRIQVSEGEELHVCSADLANAFYTLELPSQLRKFFGLRRLRAEYVGEEIRRQLGLRKGDWVYPRVKVVPMGWAWALYWCQTVNERICERSGLNKETRLHDNCATP